MSITIIVQLHARPGQEQAVADRFQVALPQTRQADGCLGLTAFRNVDQPRRFTVIERWSSREAYQAYVEWRRSTGSLDAMAARLESPIDVSYLEPVATAD
jgi:quinol monooxygenase YgiN